MENVDIDESVCRDKEQFYLILLFIVHQTPPPPCILEWSEVLNE